MAVPLFLFMPDPPAMFLRLGEKNGVWAKVFPPPKLVGPLGPWVPLLLLHPHKTDTASQLLSFIHKDISHTRSSPLSSPPPDIFLPDDSFSPPNEKIEDFELFHYRLSFSRLPPLPNHPRTLSLSPLAPPSASVNTPPPPPHPPLSPRYARTHNPHATWHARAPANARTRGTTHPSNPTYNTHKLATPSL